MWQTFTGMVNGYKITTLIILIALDFLLGIIVAIKSGTFQWNKIAGFLNTSVLCMVGGYLIVGLFAALEPSFKAMVIMVWGILEVALFAGIVNKIKILFPGIPIPVIALPGSKLTDVTLNPSADSTKPV